MRNRKSNGGSSRRNVLKSLGAGTLGFGGLSNASVVVGATEGTTRIGILAEGDEIVRDVKVPRRWKKQAEQAARAKRQISNSVGSRSDVHTVGVGNQESTIDGLKKHTVDVQVDPDGDTGGIPVVVGKSGRSEATCYTQDKSSIYGGLSSSGPDNDDSQGTLCCRAFKNGSKYMLGCRHLFVEYDDGPDYCSDADTTDEAWWRAGEVAGQVVENYPRHDAVLMDTDDTSEPVTNSIVDESGGITGRVTGNGLEYLKSSSEQVQKRGVETCITAGEVLEIRQELFCSLSSLDYVGGIVKTSTEQRNGDSGGPVYYKDGTDLYLVNIATARDSDDGYAQGSSANDIFNDQGVTFGGDPYSG
jgi:hypothetical protein